MKNLTGQLALQLQAQKCAHLLYIVQNELDMLEKLGIKNKFRLKATAKAFNQELEKEIERLMQDIPEEFQKQFYQGTNEVETAINATMLDILGLSKLKETHLTTQLA